MAGRWDDASRSEPRVATRVIAVRCTASCDEAYPSGTRCKLTIAAGIEAEAFDPSLDLLSILVERASDGGDVALVLA